MNIHTSACVQISVEQYQVVPVVWQLFLAEGATDEYRPYVTNQIAALLFTTQVLQPDWSTPT